MNGSLKGGQARDKRGVNLLLPVGDAGCLRARQGSVPQCHRQTRRSPTSYSHSISARIKEGGTSVCRAQWKAPVSGARCRFVGGERDAACGWVRFVCLIKRAASAAPLIAQQQFRAMENLRAVLRLLCRAGTGGCSTVHARIFRSRGRCRRCRRRWRSAAHSTSVAARGACG